MTRRDSRRDGNQLLLWIITSAKHAKQCYDGRLYTRMNITTPARLLALSRQQALLPAIWKRLTQAQLAERLGVTRLTLYRNLAALEALEAEATKVETILIEAAEAEPERQYQKHSQ